MGIMVGWSIVTESVQNASDAKEATEREQKQAEDLRTKVDSMLEVVSAAAEGDLTKEITVKGDGRHRPDGRRFVPVHEEDAHQYPGHWSQRRNPGVLRRGIDRDQPANGGQRGRDIGAVGGGVRRFGASQYECANGIYRRRRNERGVSRRSRKMPPRRPVLPLKR